MIVIKLKRRNSYKEVVRHFSFEILGYGIFRTTTKNSCVYFDRFVNLEDDSRSTDLYKQVVWIFRYLWNDCNQGK